jgi:hydrogenase expression/formation protein HypD
MKYLDEYRKPAEVRRFADAIARRMTKPWSLMEVCGGQTHALVRFGIDQLLPKELTLLHGPGCPVCVTPLETIDRALAIASRPEVIFCSYGDMLRVPGSNRDLFGVRARGGDVRVVYSAMDAVEIAAAEPTREVVFLAVGFETTAPAHAMAVLQARARGLRNFSLLVSHVLVPPALESILGSEPRRVDAFLAAGHVCTVMGTSEYEPIVRTHHVPIVVTGFEPLDLVHGIHMCIEQLEAGRAELENQYARSVRDDGNRAARDAIAEVFEVVPRKWRGIGEIRQSGLGLRRALADFDAEQRFEVDALVAEEPKECISGLVMLGLKKPSECEAFATRCTPETPIGATMVSAEGACAAYYRYRRSAS